jgi:phage gpG-like protein
VTATLGLTIVVEIDGMQRRLQTLVKTVKELEPALRLWDTYYRARVQRRFASEGPGWAPRKEEELARRDARNLGSAKSRALYQVERKLHKELRRASHSVDPQTYARRFFVLKEFERLRNGGSENLSTIGSLSKADRSILRQRSGIVRSIAYAKSIGDKANEEGQRQRLENFDFAHDQILEAAKGLRALRSVRGLAARVERAEARSQGKVLGKIAQSIRSKVSKGAVTVYSAIPWAGIHNEGGTAGHGAQIKPRPFLFLESQDIDVLQEILINMMLAAVA